ncbi:DNA-directed RNA polymerase subunit omega [Natranaerofaba carboxydovora]|uniref:DNA-directed RNA polymerase subunit omega n=1 Tax=Natranaerofaba carboxydovora TaxID=2742683 RepID=UPI001F132AA9|nr:DNA-directed RNA polymerase subunit omega [Natranaerofaba carboxydovora]UMZ73293.1 DNA-directed RNA polymerase subunit omega [Natranaerofaba carboxydovora]
MKEPSVDELVGMVDSKYTLVIASAKRARQIVDGSEVLVDTDAKKSVSIALEEIKNKKLDIYREPGQGIK